MKIGIVSNKSSIDIITSFIEYKKMNNVQIEQYHYDIFEDVKKVLDIAQKNVDALLFGGKAVYEYSLSIVSPAIPWKFIDKGETSFLRAFIDALIRGYDISKISIDSCDDDRYAKLSSIYWMVGMEKVRIYNVEGQAQGSKFLNKKYVMEIYENHKRKFEDNEVTCCFTCYDNVFCMLKESKIPVVRIDFTIDDIMNKIIQLKNIHEYDLSNQNEMAVISIEFDCPREQYKDQADFNFMNLQKLTILKEIYKFADGLQGIINVSENITGIMIISTKKLLDMETDNMTRLQFVEVIRQKSMLTLSIGIGIGANLKTCHKDALKAKELSKMFGGNCTYILHNSNIIGPVFEKKDIFEEKEDIFMKISDISCKTKLSNSQVLKLMEITEQYSLDVFTSKQLADLFGYSLRSINKLISKLEEFGYAEVIGTSYCNDRKGRPYRLIKLKNITNG